MGIGIQRETCGEVSQHSGHSFDIYAILECESCKRVAEVMKAHLGNPAKSPQVVAGRCESEVSGVSRNTSFIPLSFPFFRNPAFHAPILMIRLGQNLRKMVRLILKFSNSAFCAAFVPSFHRTLTKVLETKFRKKGVSFFDETP